MMRHRFNMLLRQLATVIIIFCGCQKLLNGNMVVAVALAVVIAWTVVSTSFRQTFKVKKKFFCACFRLHCVHLSLR